MATEVRVPTLGESVTEATVATWFKKPGDAVKVDEMLCELETDKVTVEVPSPVAGAAPAPAAAAPAPAGGGRTDVEDAPSAKKAMADAGLSRDQVQGTGRDGRIMKEDVARATAGGAAASIPQSQREERVKMTRLR